MLVKAHICFVLALIVVCPVAAFQNSEQLPQRAAIRTSEGALFIWNQPGNNFSLEIKGKDVRPNNSSKDVYFKVDGLVLQIQCAAISQVTNDRRDVQTVLNAHKDWETQYAATVLGQQPKVQSVTQKSADGRELLYWSFDMPENFTGPGKTRLFLTTVNGEYVIVLTAVIMSSGEEQRVRQLLFDTLATLKVSVKPFEVPQPHKESL